MGILIGVFSAAVFMDWRYYRIPNVCTAVGMANGLILTYMSFSWLGLARALGGCGCAVCGILSLLSAGGAGGRGCQALYDDGLLSSLLEQDGLLHYMLATMALAAVSSLVKMAAYPESRERLLYLMRYIRKAVLTGAMDDYETGQTKKRCVVRLSIPAFLSLLLMGAGVYR